MVKERDYWFDNAKFVLIAAVILGHCIDRLGVGPICLNANTTMSFFRMPMFIFISGYFSKKMEWPRFWGVISGILETYLIMSLLHIGYSLFNGVPFSIAQLIEPRWTLWYLLCIVFWRAIIQVCDRVKPIYLVSTSILIGVFSGFVPLYSIFSLQRVFSMAPFFMLGFFCRQEKLSIRGIKKLHPLLAIAFLILVYIFVSRLDFPMLSFLRGKYPYIYFKDYSLWLLPLVRLAVYVGSIVTSICVMRLIPEKKSWMSNEGINTLLYYLYHPFIIVGMQFGERFINLPSSLIAMLFYTVLIVFIIWLLIKIKFFRDLPRLFTKVFSWIVSRA